MDKAVILARGLGTRMQKKDDSSGLTKDQAQIAEKGVKGMIPVGRPFMDHVISGLADAGYTQVCLVIGPEHDVVRRYYESLRCIRVSIDFAVQQEPFGTADAVAAAEEFAGDDEFCVINSDNYYPVEALKILREMDGPGTVVFEREGLITKSNIEPDRIAGFAVVQTDKDGWLAKIIEKPDSDILRTIDEPVCVSMNCWRFDGRIFRACRSIERSVRGEYELPAAVEYAVEKLGVRFRAVQMHAGVLDMSSRKDIKTVAEKLANSEVLL